MSYLSDLIDKYLNDRGACSVPEQALLGHPTSFPVRSSWNAPETPRIDVKSIADIEQAAVLIKEAKVPEFNRCINCVCHTQLIDRCFEIGKCVNKIGTWVDECYAPVIPVSATDIPMLPMPKSVQEPGSGEDGIRITTWSIDTAPTLDQWQKFDDHSRKRIY